MIKIPMNRVKETKNTFRYESGDPLTDPVDCVYIKKSALAGFPPPDSIDVVVLVTPAERRSGYCRMPAASAAEGDPK